MLLYLIPPLLMVAPKYNIANITHSLQTPSVKDCESLLIEPQDHSLSRVSVSQPREKPTFSYTSNATVPSVMDYCNKINMENNMDIETNNDISMSWADQMNTVSTTTFLSLNSTNYPVFKFNPPGNSHIVTPGQHKALSAPLHIDTILFEPSLIPYNTNKLIDPSM